MADTLEAPLPGSSTDTVDSSTPATSLSEHGPTPECSAESPQPINDGIDSLDNYIPVGILRRIARDKPHTTPVPVPENFPYLEAVTLEGHRWIRTTTHAYQGYPHLCYSRVYVLPDDVGRKAISRSSSSLRRALKVVMAKVDSSVGAWMGELYPGEKSDKKSSASAEDESMWYIFNTLRDPEPRVEKMKDLYARKAMEELLSGSVGGEAETGQELGVLGLKTPLYSYQRRSAAAMIQREVQPAQMLDPRLQAFCGPTGQVYYYDKEEGSIVREKRMYSEACGGRLLLLVDEVFPGGYLTFTRNPRRDHGLRKDANQFGGHHGDTGPLSQDPFGISGDRECRTSEDGVSSRDGRSRGRSIFASVESPLRDRETLRL